MILHRARWVLPIVSPPIRDGWVTADRGIIAAIGGPGDEIPTMCLAPEAPLAPEAAEVIMPGLVNAHTHLELSWLRGQVPQAEAMPEWAARLINLRRQVGADPVDPIVAAVREARTFGTTLVADVGNSIASFEPLADSELSAVIFRELLGFNADAAAVVAAAAAELAELMPIARLRPVLVPHAPYSVSPALFRAIAAAAEDRPISVHAGESGAELEFLRNGTGPWRALLERLGVWDPGWTAPGCGPVEYLHRLGLVNERLMAVHGVCFTDAELERLAGADATVVTCPRSNRWTGAGDPVIERFYRSGVRVAVGTDSLASVEDLSVFGELAAVRRLAPLIEASRLLRSATLDGATALGFGAELGSIEPGKRAELIAVRLPDDVQDVEEYLVGGIDADAIRWLGAR